MFVGHLAVALAGKKAARTVPLPWLMVAANLADLVWPLFLLAGLERVRIAVGDTAVSPLAFESYPWTHSLLMSAVWAAAIVLLARWRGVSERGSWVIGPLVVSHWVLDYISHRPDMPLWPWAYGAYGLGLWYSVAATFAVEGLLWCMAIAIFLSASRPRGAAGHAAFWSFVLVSTFLWVSGPFSPPPVDVGALARFALVGWVIVPWAWWMERTSRAAVRDRY